MTHLPSASSENSLRLGLHWLMRVRWLAVGIFFLLCVWAWGVLGVRLPFEIFGPCLGAMAVGNLIAARLRGVGRREKEWMIGLLLFGDIGLLTVMLFFAGGAHNPFTLFYILYVVLVAVLLPGWAAWSALVAAAGGFALLFSSPFPLVSDCGGTCCDDMQAHLMGMVVAMTLTGAALTYFVTRLGRSLAEADILLVASRAAEEDGRRFASLATLAAGVAHELATPLGTIAIASRELERSAGSAACCADCASDARLIRSEVGRCRAVIERLSEQALDRAGEVPGEVGCEDLPALLEPHLPGPLAGRLQWECCPGRFRLPLGGLLRALAILAKNACEASAGPVRIRVSREGRMLEFRVSDSGEGMSADVLGRLGEPFFSRKGEGGGMGLGLFLVKLFCDQHGGGLSFDSEPGRGTDVFLRLPILPV